PYTAHWLIGSSFSVKAFICCFADGWYKRSSSVRPYARALRPAPCHTPVRSGFPSHDARGTALAGVAARAAPLCWAAEGSDEARVKQISPTRDEPTTAAAKAFPMSNDSSWNCHLASGACRAKYVTTFGSFESIERRRIH